MKTTHQIHYKNSKNMRVIPSGSVHLVVTSPPYPMIEMWDSAFTLQDPAISKAMEANEGIRAFELMHRQLDAVWEELFRILVPGGIACINVGDAVRTVRERFMLYPNHSRIMTRMMAIGFTPLPEILWRKQTNAPNKFMGSGMLPAGAYVTLEHEFILIFRKGMKRGFIKPREKTNRRESAFFWEERNNWFSDIWFDLKGTPQKLNDSTARKRSGAYPFELPYRLINMYSAKGDVVVDPFFGTGTTMSAAMAAGRDSIGFEIRPEFKSAVLSRIETIVDFSNARISDRIQNHLAFVEQRTQTKGPLKYINRHYQFPVMTRQETALLIDEPEAVSNTGENCFQVDYAEAPRKEFVFDGQTPILATKKAVVRKPVNMKKGPVQLNLLDI